MYTYVGEHKSTIEETLPFLKSKLDEFSALKKDGLEPRILAINLMLNGVRSGVRVEPGVKTEDQTHCDCGMEICIDDLGRKGDELVTRSYGLLHAWSEYQTKISILRVKYEENEEGKQSPAELELNLD